MPEAALLKYRTKMVAKIGHAKKLPTKNMPLWYQYLRKVSLGYPIF